VKRVYCSVMVTLRSLIINRGPVRQKLIGFLRVWFFRKNWRCMRVCVWPKRINRMFKRCNEVQLNWQSVAVGGGPAKKSTIESALQPVRNAGWKN
jgi:hypothetical protein